jgi:hypothetical protein
MEITIVTNTRKKIVLLFYLLKKPKNKTIKMFLILIAIYFKGLILILIFRKV